jgi:hypothetical protein
VLGGLLFTNFHTHGVYAHSYLSFNLFVDLNFSARNAVIC